MSNVHNIPLADALGAYADTRTMKFVASNQDFFNSVSPLHSQLLAEVEKLLCEHTNTVLVLSGRSQARDDNQSTVNACMRWISTHGKDISGR